MKLDQDLLKAFREGETAGGAGANYRDNPYFYTSSMSDAWALGHWLTVTRRILDVDRILGLSSRGLVYENADRQRRRYRVSYISCTRGHDFAHGYA